MTEAFIPIESSQELSAKQQTSDSTLEFGVDNLVDKSKTEKIKDVVATGFVASELLPVNELLRSAIYGGTVIMTGNNTLTSAAAVGISTLAIEGAGAIAGARLLSTRTSNLAYDRTNSRLRRIGINKGDKISLATKSGAALLGGSVVAMALEKRDNDEISKNRLRSYGLKTSLWLGGVVAVGGAAASEGIDLTKEKPLFGTALVVSLGALAMGRSIRKRNKLNRSTPELIKSWRKDSDKYGLSYGYVNDELSLKKAANLEQDVWNEMGYGDLDEEGYTNFIKNSRTFVALNSEGECIGVNRMFQAKNEELPPFLEMSFYNEEEKELIAGTAKAGDTEELGTVAVAEKYRGKRVNLRLWRLAYRDARERGIKYWGIIMEPERVEKMNKYQGFTFKQLGPAVPYQGGDCAPFIMELQEVDDSMSKDHKLNYYWFVRKKLKS